MRLPADIWRIIRLIEPNSVACPVGMLPRAEIDVRAAQHHDLAAPASGQHRKPQRRRMDRQPILGRHFGQHAPEAVELVVA